MNPKFFRNGIVMLALVVVALAVVITLVTQSSTSTDKAYSGPNSFLQDVQAGNVSSVTQEGSKLTVVTKDQPPATYTVVVPGLLAEALPDIQAAAAAGKVPAPRADRQAAVRHLVARPDHHRPPADPDHRRVHLLHDATGPGHE